MHFTVQTEWYTGQVTRLDIALHCSDRVVYWTGNKTRYCNSLFRQSGILLHVYTTVLRKNLASAKILKTEFNANLYLLAFPHFITFKKCKKMP